MPRARRTPSQPAARRVAARIAPRPRRGEPNERRADGFAEWGSVLSRFAPGGQTGTAPKPRRSLSVPRSLEKIFSQRELDLSGFIEDVPPHPRDTAPSPPGPVLEG
jgi:hypothetical protein